MNMYWLEVLSYNENGQPYYETEEVNADSCDVLNGVVVFRIKDKPAVLYPLTQVRSIDFPRDE